MYSMLKLLLGIGETRKKNFSEILKISWDTLTIRGWIATRSWIIDVRAKMIYILSSSRFLNLYILLSSHSFFPYPLSERTNMP